MKCRDERSAIAEPADMKEATQPGAAPRKQKAVSTEEQCETKETLSFPLSNLSEAIGGLKGACTRLQSSVEGINSDLEDMNKSLLSALKTHSEAAACLENILASIPTGVVVVDNQGNIVLLNRAVEVITGFRNEDVRGASYQKTIGRDIPQKLTPLYTLATGSPIDRDEKTLRTDSGDRIPVSFSTSLLVNEDNEIAGAIEVITDLRRVKLLEAEVSRAKTLATIGEVAAVVAHEIRNPLGGIKGFASLLERDLRANPESLEMVHRIKEGIDALESIVTDLLETGRHTQPKFRHTNVAPEIRRVVEMSKMAAEGEGKRIEFRTVIGDEPIYCRVDRGRLKQAVVNLIRNACEAVGDAGTVTVKAYSKTVSAEGNDSSRPGRPLRDYLCIEVADTGPGISREALEKMFSPFFTTKRDGTGLGLSTVRRIAALHGGEVRYVKPESGGSRFIIEIPRW
jgi:two-component system nitrogen regulation sensor histidine kinase GlnL